MSQYECESCKYLFKPKTGKVPAICPYCNTSGSIKPKRSMQDLIDETLSGMED